ncbi:polyprenyl synthetase family protein [Catellatospora chokoriensis]|uniref:Geranylgeranyl pyrophosphate synthase n=1 Tax=Catellatospora chokoriensis TaxID=310353 RepID=A0A8J3K6Q2_9ACTN|nr:polyprenyl synthetase family protein [Catellatospora chokoriensis]GIF93623.1 geranylgeranyl pyrophosphate synthase [Catellatospora chokoriensis]
MTVSPAIAAITLDPHSRQRVHDHLRTAAASDVAWLDEAVAGLLSRPAKQLRPALVHAAAACGDAPAGDDVARCAAAVELLHLSSLVHDDIMDGSPTRGGLAAVHATYGAAAALLVGDHLAAAGGRLAAEVSLDAAAQWQKAYRAMCGGQARELVGTHRLGTARDYRTVIAGKTAALFAAAGHVGARAAGLPPATAAALGRYGHHFGMLLQILDDLMDLLSTDLLWGKPVGQDLRNGVYTLAVIHAAASHGPELARPLSPDADAAALAAVAKAARTVGTGPVIAAAAHEARQARLALRVLPESAARQRLSEVPHQYLISVLSERPAPEHAHHVRPHLTRINETEVKVSYVIA